MRNEADEWADREDEAEFWRNYKGRRGWCGLVALGLLTATLLVAAGVMSL